MQKEDKYDLVFKALVDSRRREILDLLNGKSRTTGELIERFRQLDRCTVKQAPERSRKGRSFHREA
jgi:DNA-binding transcriptional ArsR family regulator